MSGPSGKSSATDLPGMNESEGGSLGSGEVDGVISGRYYDVPRDADSERTPGLGGYGGGGYYGGDGGGGTAGQARTGQARTQTEADGEVIDDVMGDRYDDLVDLSEYEDYSERILQEIGTSTQQQPVGFFALGGYLLSKAGVSEKVTDTPGGRYPDASGYIRSGHLPAGSRSDGRRGVSTGVLADSSWYDSVEAVNTWRGLELRPFFLDDTLLSTGASPFRDASGYKNSLEIKDVTDVYTGMLATRGQAVNEGYSGLESTGNTGARGSLDDTVSELMQLTGTIGLTAFVSNQYSGTDYGALMTGETSLSTAIVVGHLGFGADAQFEGAAIVQGTFQYASAGGTMTLPRGPGPSAGAFVDEAFMAGLDQTAFAENTYYVCDMSPFFYNPAEAQVLRTKFGYDAMTFSDHPYIGTRERIYQGISEIILDIEEDVLVRVDSTKFVNGGNASEIKINRIETSELAEDSTFSPSGAGMSGPSTSSDPGGGTYGY
jgi:hypothetical protein